MVITISTKLYRAFLLAMAFLTLGIVATPVLACCPAPPPDQLVVNADQTVIIIWDAATQTEHFIRKASFASAADDFGFLIPTPSQPELNESGNDAFPFLQKLTEPELFSDSHGFASGATPAPEAVTVLEEKLVAGFNAVVLEANSADALVNWLKGRGFAFSPEVRAWAKPYVDAGWKITALKVSKSPKNKDNKVEQLANNNVSASALRMSFKTARPLFPYREPDPKGAAKTLGKTQRLLRIYFISDARYQGELTKETPWSGKVVWTNKLSSDDRSQALSLLKLPETTGPTEWRLTEFEDNWPYKVAPADLYFSRSANQDTVKRPAIHY